MWQTCNQSVLTKTKFFVISSLTSARSDWNRAMWSAPDSRATVSKLRPMWIMTSVLCWSYGFMSDVRNRRSSRTHGRLYGIGGTAWWFPGHHKHTEMLFTASASACCFTAMTLLVRQQERHPDCCSNSKGSTLGTHSLTWSTLKN